MLLHNLYGTPVDVWSCGCILAELHTKKWVLVTVMRMKIMNRERRKKRRRRRRRRSRKRGAGVKKDDKGYNDGEEKERKKRGKYLWW